VKPSGYSGGFLDFACANAGGAHLQLFAIAAHQRAYQLQVGIPTPAPSIIGVTHYVAVLRTFAAQFTLHCHFYFLILR
jgi:hypothetical protein